eukprot:scaffold8973_cov75-Skeletonema_dohrnii-CCMP3373.AAC.7
MDLDFYVTAQLLMLGKMWTDLDAIEAESIRGIKGSKMGRLASADESVDEMNNLLDHIQAAYELKEKKSSESRLHRLVCYEE